ncbi:MAG: hypothetical protein Fur0040_06680 [Sideroxydans sp.]
MKHARIFSLTVTLIVALYGAIGFYLMPQATFTGELTRMALLPESLFGWTRPQPPVAQHLLRQATMEEADVLVIGDSFSIPLVWQSVLVRQGIKVRTESWDSVRGICGDLLPWLRARGFRGNTIVIESIERMLEDRLRGSVGCEHMDYHALPNTEAPRLPPATHNDPHYTNFSSPLSISIRTAWQTYTYDRLHVRPDFSSWMPTPSVRLVHVANGCALFSHAACGDSLFLAEDSSGEIAAAAMEHMTMLQQRLAGMRVVWAIVPNKSTVYLHPAKQFWQQAKQHLNAPDLLHTMRAALQHGSVDLYPANNTHCSTEGYLLMGEEILQAIRSAERTDARK